MKKLLILILFTFPITDLYAQPSPTLMSLADSANFYSIRDSVELYFDTAGIDTTNFGEYKRFKRWEYFWSHRVGVVGDSGAYNIGSFQPAFAAMATLHSQATVCNGGPSFDNDYHNWSFIGHSSTEESGGNSRGQGITVKVHVDRNDHDKIYLGTNHSGLWRTEDGGVNWSCITKNRYPGMGVKDFVMNPTDPNIMYIATGMGYDDFSTYGMGILKTENGTDPNPTWETTG